MGNRKNQENELQKANYVRIALAFQGIAVDDYHALLFLRTIKAVQEKGGMFTISDAVQIKYDVETEFTQKKALTDEGKTA